MKLYLCLNFSKRMVQTMTIFLSLIFFFEVNAKNEVSGFSRDSLYTAGMNHFKDEDFLRATDNFSQYISIQENKKPSQRVAAAYLHLGICYDYFEYFEISRSYFLKAFTMYSALNDVRGMGYCLTHLGDMYEDHDQNKNALKFQRKALRYFIAVKDLKGKAVVYDNISSIYENMEELDSARFYLEHALKLYRQLNDSLGMAVVLNNFGDISKKDGEIKKALQFYEQSLGISKKINSQEEQRGNFKDLAKLFAEKENFKQAYFYFSQFYEAHRKLKIEKKIEEISRIQLKLQDEKQNLLLERIRSKEKIYLLSYTIAGLLFFICLFASWILYRSYLTKHKKEKQLLIQKNASITSELEVKRKEMIDYIRILAKKQEEIEQLNELLSHQDNFRPEQSMTHYQGIAVLTQSKILTEESWKEFKRKFDNIYHGFFSRLSIIYPQMSQGDVRLAALIKLKLNQKDIADMMGISPDSVKKAKTRLKKKVSFGEDFSLKNWAENL